ncbi:unnamed protein product [Rhizophagus irregularis]|nr:unnamed protein product [Rhizophagus irregularis]
MTLPYLTDDSEILQLKNQLGLSQINNINFDNFDKEHKPLFEYPKYLKYLKNCNNFIINFVISKWFAKYIPNLPIFCVDNIFPIFLQSILRQSRNIEQLDISLNLFYEESFKNFNFQNFTSNLTKLNSLSLNFNSSGTDHTVNKEIEQEFLRNIANFCTNASKLIIELPEIRRPLYQHDTSNGLIITTTTLEKLCILLNQCESLNFSSFKLKELSFKHNYWNVDVASLMIKYLGASLQRLLVETPSSSLIKNISIYCPNLIFLEIIIDSHIDLSVIQLFKNLRTRILSISTLCDDTDKFFINLANNISINIDKIFINSYSRNSSRLLKYKKYKEFLENCHNRFEMINLKYIIELEFFKIVLNYIERSNNSLKVLGMMKCKKLNDEELKLLNLIKAKGVEIVNYSTIYHDLCKFVF